MAQPTPGARLRAFRESLNLTLREAAEQLHVTHPALRQWELDEVIPSEPFRLALQKWSGGKLTSEMWGLTPREERIAEQLAEVATARPGKTGTDGS